MIKEETKIEFNILTILPVTPPPPLTHTPNIIKILKENKDSKGRNQNRIKHYFQVLKSNIHVQLVYLKQFLKF